MHFLDISVMVGTFIHYILYITILNKFGTIPELPLNMQQLDHILNSIPKSEAGLVLGKWKTVWPALIRVLREIDILSHPEETFEDDEPAPEEALERSVSPITSPDLSISIIIASFFQDISSTPHFSHSIYFFSRLLFKPPTCTFRHQL